MYQFFLHNQPTLLYKIGRYKFGKAKNKKKAKQCKGNNVRKVDLQLIKVGLLMLQCNTNCKSATGLPSHRFTNDIDSMIIRTYMYCSASNVKNDLNIIAS